MQMSCWQVLSALGSVRVDKCLHIVVCHVIGFQVCIRWPTHEPFRAESQQTPSPLAKPYCVCIVTTIRSMQSQAKLLACF